MSDEQFFFQRFDKSSDVVDAVFHLGRRQECPGVADLLIIELQPAHLLVLYAHLFRELSQGHVCEIIGASEFKAAKHLALQHFPVIGAEHLIRFEMIQALKILELIAEVMYIYDHPAIIFKILFHAGQELKELMPVTSHDGLIRAVLELPYEHDVLIHVRQVGRFNIESCKNVDISLSGLFVAVRF